MYYDDYYDIRYGGSYDYYIRDDDVCCECALYGDNYRTDESGERVWKCPICPLNHHLSKRAMGCSAQYALELQGGGKR